MRILFPETMYWSDHTGPVNSVDIETTAYALLAMLQYDYIASAKVVTWFKAQRDAIFAREQTQVKHFRFYSCWSLKSKRWHGFIAIFRITINVHIIIKHNICSFLTPIS